MSALTVLLNPVCPAGSTVAEQLVAYRYTPGTGLKDFKEFDRIERLPFKKRELPLTERYDSTTTRIAPLTGIGSLEWFHHSCARQQFTPYIGEIYGYNQLFAC